MFTFVATLTPLRFRFARDALNVLLSMTGTASCDLMLVLTTSSPQALDEAVLDRMDELIGLRLPEKKERRKILQAAFEKRFRKREASGEGEGGIWKKVFGGGDCRVYLEGWGERDVEKALDLLSEDRMTKGCSGRELEKMLQAVLTNVYGAVDGDGNLRRELWDRVVGGYSEELEEKRKLSKGRGETTEGGGGGAEGSGSPKHTRMGEPELSLE